MTMDFLIAIDSPRAAAHHRQPEPAHAPTALPDIDPRLVERAKSGALAFTELYRRLYPVVAGYVYRRTGDRHATEDITAEVFLSLFRNLASFRERGVPFSAYVLRIASNAVNRWARRRSRADLLTSLAGARLRSRAAAAHARLNADHAAGGRMDSSAPHDAERSRVLRAMHALPPAHQEALALVHVEGLSVAQAACVVGCSEGTIKSRLSRARQQLRDRLNQSEVCDER